MNKICPKCHFIGKAKQPFFSKLALGLAIIMFGIFIYFKALDSSLILGLVTAAISGCIVFLGVKTIISHFSGNLTCPNCNHKPMLTLDNPEALKLIMKYDLKLGDNPLPTPQKEPNPDLSNPTKP